MAVHPSDELREAIQAAHVFLDRAEALKSATIAEPGTHPKESAALKRASMDLTRALAEYRRAGGWACQDR